MLGDQGEDNGCSTSNGFGIDFGPREVPQPENE